jgi:hypothetical protein
MPVSKNMSMPGKVNDTYAEQVLQQQGSSNTADNLFQQSQFIPVPGPRGDRGEKGEKGEMGAPGAKGDIGLRGENGRDGKDGKNGKDGKDGISLSGQIPGWAKYNNKDKTIFDLGISEGDNGWVSLFLKSDKENSIETFSTSNQAAALWSNDTKCINFLAVKVGARVDIIYDIELTTFSSNTDVWMRTFFHTIETDFPTFVGCFKYQGTYSLSVSQSIYIESNKFNAFARPQIRTDMGSQVALKSITVSLL